MSKTLIKIEQIGSPIRRHHSQRETLMVRPTMAFGADTEGNRAAIMGYGIGAPRDWAEALARLDPAQPPADVPDGRWQRFIDDCGVFLDSGWGEPAAAG
jgi:hypothetical protein